MKESTEVVSKKLLKNLAKFIGKHLCQCRNEFAATLIKRIFVIESFLGKVVSLLTGLILTTYCIWYQPAVSFFEK